MLLKFAYQDFLDDRRFKNTTKTDIKNYEMHLGKNQVVNVEDITYSHVRQYLLNCQEKWRQGWYNQHQAIKNPNIFK